MPFLSNLTEQRFLTSEKHLIKKGIEALKKKKKCTEEQIERQGSNQQCLTHSKLVKNDEMIGLVILFSIIFIIFNFHANTEKKYQNFQKNPGKFIKIIKSQEK